MSLDLMRAFDLSGAGLGHLAACFFYAYLLMQIPAGLILDRFSPRLVLFCAAFFCAVGTILFAEAHWLPVAQFSRFLIGLTSAFAAIACFKLITIWFPPHRFALIAGLSMTAAMLGAIGGEAPLSYLISRFDWRQSLEIIAVPGFILAFLILLIVKDKQPKAGLPKQEGTTFSKLTTILVSPQTWLLSFYSGLAFAPVSVFGGLWGVSFIEKAYGMNPVQAASLVSLIFVGFAIGCPLSGWLSDYTQKRKPLMFWGTLMAYISITLILYGPITRYMLPCLLFLFGFGTSCFFLCFSMVRETHSLLLAGTALGFMNTFDALCEALTEPFVGKLLDLSWSGGLALGARSFSVLDYRFGLSTLPIYLAIAFCLLFFIRETYCQAQIINPLEK